MMETSNTHRHPPRIWLTVACALGAFVLAARITMLLAAPINSQPETATEPSYLTPVEIKLSADGKKLYVVCEDDDSVIAVDTQTRQVVAKAKVGHKPKGLAISPDGKTLYVSNEWSDTVSEVDAATFVVKRTLKTGWGPVGLVTDRAGKTLYVANSIADSVSLIDLASGAEIKRFVTHRYPEQMTLSRDGRRVYVSNILPHLGPYDQPPVSELLALDTARQVVAERILIPGTIELRHIAEAPPTLSSAPDRQIVASISDRRIGGQRPPLQAGAGGQKPALQGGDLLIPLMRPKNLGPLIQVSQGWMMTHGMAVVRPNLSGGLGAAPSKVTQVLLDDIDYYFATNSGVAFSPDGRRALVTSADADIVSILDTGRLSERLRQVPAEELANRLDSAVTFVVKRLPTGHNPTSVVVSPDSRWAYVTNRLDDSVTVVDVAQARVASTIELGGPKEITLMRRGEQMFHTAKVCFQGQFACGTCHPNSHLDGLAWNIETPQLGRDRVANRTLRGIRETAPYKWNGKNPDLATQCGPRIAKYFFRSEGFGTADLEALLTYLNNIPLAPNRHLAADGQLTEAQERGKAIFYRQYTNDGRVIPLQNRCDTCHPAATHYTARYSTEVGSTTPYDTNAMFDIPQLDRVYEDAPYMHNGEALTLEEIWTVFNNSDKHGLTSDMNKEQLNDLIEYLKTL
jgi:YVTN family beta-propeller protein